MIQQFCNEHFERTRPTEEGSGDTQFGRILKTDARNAIITQLRVELIFPKQWGFSNEFGKIPIGFKDTLDTVTVHYLETYNAARTGIFARAGAEPYRSSGLARALTHVAHCTRVMPRHPAPFLQSIFPTELSYSASLSSATLVHHAV